nr:MAG TPA: hypothetical protein [Caudoviricetes sp.]
MTVASATSSIGSAVPPANTATAKPATPMPPTGLTPPAPNGHRRQSR